MSRLASLENYLDNDVAYLLGLILMRGAFYEENDLRRLVIKFPYKLLVAKSVPGSRLKFERETAIRLSLDNVRNTVMELLGQDLIINRSPNEVSLTAVFTRNTMAWRNLKTLFKDKNSFLEFIIPDVIWDSPLDIKKDFMRGIADAASNPSPGDAGPDKRQRIVIEFSHKNWMLPLQVCRLLQEELGVNVAHVLWGHPNIRASTQTSDLRSWKKEHRMRIMAEDFVPISYAKFEYKQKLFEELLKWNQKRKLDRPTKPCNPKRKKPKRRHPPHQGEKSKDLPPALQRHFDASFQVCLALGCEQGEEGGSEEAADE